MKYTATHAFLFLSIISNCQMLNKGSVSENVNMTGNAIGGDLKEFVHAPAKAKVTKRSAVPQPQGDDYYDKVQGEIDSEEYFEKREWSDINRPHSATPSVISLNSTDLSHIDGVISITENVYASLHVGITQKTYNNLSQNKQKNADPNNENKKTVEHNENSSSESIKSKGNSRVTRTINNENYEDAEYEINISAEDEAKKAKALETLDDLRLPHVGAQRSERFIENKRTPEKQAPYKAVESTKPKHYYEDYDDEEVKNLYQDKYKLKWKPKILTTTTPKPTLYPEVVTEKKVSVFGDPQFYMVRNDFGDENLNKNLTKIKDLNSFDSNDHAMTLYPEVATKKKVSVFYNPRFYMDRDEFEDMHHNKNTTIIKELKYSNDGDQHTTTSREPTFNQIEETTASGTVLSTPSSFVPMSGEYKKHWAFSQYNDKNLTTEKNQSDYSNPDLYTISVKYQRNLDGSTKPNFFTEVNKNTTVIEEMKNRKVEKDYDKQTTTPRYRTSIDMRTTTAARLDATAEGSSEAYTKNYEINLVPSYAAPSLVPKLRQIHWLATHMHQEKNLTTTTVADFGKALHLKGPQQLEEPYHGENATSEETCVPLRSSVADIDTVSAYSSFDFRPSWLRTKEFWDGKFEERYERTWNHSRRHKLKVFVVPHSHNDPGWLKTFEEYFQTKTKSIISNVVSKLQQYQNMTFIWSEISFLHAWWESAHPDEQKALKRLVAEGRVEIATGGWVMPDEAGAHVYALLDQLIEGHVWVKHNLGIAPKSGWSIDPFGHGPTVPHLLELSGLQGTVIQRIHYAWKQWLAERQVEEFHWLPGWTTRKPQLIVHNLPFFIYTISSTCGPHSSVCLRYDFTSNENITDQNLDSKAKALIEEYQRIGTLTSHNVALVPLGEDFRYNNESEFDQQYVNYQIMFNYINSRPELFNAEVQFGTLHDYFKTVTERHKDIPSLRGDFFVYADIFDEGRPAYWSGYYTTRPYLKILARQFEHHLRTAEIMFTIVSNLVKQSNTVLSPGKRLEKAYEQLVVARRNLGLFQHHDAITGTARAYVMEDYGTRMFTSLHHCIQLQETALTALMILDESLHGKSVLQSELEWDTYEKPVKRLHVSPVHRNKIILFNPLLEPRTEVITVRSNTTDVRVVDTFTQQPVQYQVSPTLDARDRRRVLSAALFDVHFVATLPPLSARTFSVQHHVDASARATVFCNNCNTEYNKNFVVQNLSASDIQLENTVLKVLFNRHTGFMRQVYRKDIKKKNVVEMQFGAYQSAQRHSGAYLFKPEQNSPERNVLASYVSSGGRDDHLIIISGPVTTELTALYEPFLVHTTRIFNVEIQPLANAIYIENIVDFESPPKNRETELYMRLHTDIQNGQPPEFYTDQNGFQYQKRVKVDKLGIEGNYYPITTMAWIQDVESRLTLVTSHAQGAASWEPGRLELMLDRRTQYDDGRGLGEGVVDNRQTYFQNWLFIEPTPSATRMKRDTTDNERHFNTKQPDLYQVPTESVDYLSRTLNYPVNVYLIDGSEAGEVATKSQYTLVKDFPSGLHLLTLRTMTDDILKDFPSTSCFMVLQRPGKACDSTTKSTRFTSLSRFSGLSIKNLTSTSLTGLHAGSTLSGLSSIRLDPMDMKTFKIKF